MSHKTWTIDGKRVPSVTTITNLWGDKGGLLYWANQQGLEGNTLQDARQSTATPGSMTHERVDCHIKGVAWNQEAWADKFTTPELYRDALDKTERAFGNFVRWSQSVNLKLIEGELPLLSKVHRFGGTVDAIATSEGVCLADWKTGTSGSIYADYLYQIAGYGILWEENFPDRPITGGYHIIRFNREYGDFSHWHFSELADAREGFLMLRELYDIHKRIQKRIK